MPVNNTPAERNIGSDNISLNDVVRRQHAVSPIVDNISNSGTHDEEVKRQSSENNITSDACNEEDSSSVVRRRGPNRGSRIPPNSDERTKIHVVMNKFVEIEVARNITNDIKGAIKDAWPTWKKVPNDEKNLLWDNFKLRYKWDNLTDREMKKVWNENAGERYRSAIHLAKKTALSLAYEELEREPTTSDMIGRGPEWIDAEIWNNLVNNHWNKEDHEIKCEVARNNRMTMKDGSITRHAGGSISFGTHRERMKKDLGREVDDFEVFERMHKRKQGTGEFVDNKSARVSEKYREKQNADDQSAHHSFDLNSWCDVVGRPSKGRVYGYGRGQHFGRAYNGNSLIPASNEMCSNEENKDLSKEIEDMCAASKRMEQEINESNKKLELAIIESRQREEKLIEEGRQREENLKEMVRKMIQEVGYTNHFFPGGSGPRQLRYE